MVLVDEAQDVVRREAGVLDVAQVTEAGARSASCLSHGQVRLNARTPRRLSSRATPAFFTTLEVKMSLQTP